MKGTLMSPITDGFVIIAEAQPDGTVTLQEWPLLMDNKAQANYLTPDGIFPAEPVTTISPTTGIVTRGTPGRVLKIWHPNMTKQHAPLTRTDVQQHAMREALASVEGNLGNGLGRDSD